MWVRTALRHWDDNTTRIAMHDTEAEHGVWSCA
jgi:hypothetical protein